MSRPLRIPLVTLAVLVPVLLLLGIWLGGHPGLVPGPVRSMLVADDVRALDAALDIIERDYYRPVDRGKLVNDGLEGAVAQLHDRFSRYLDPAAYRRMLLTAEGRFSGVGLQVAQAAAGLRVDRVFPRSPAARAGIRPGDQIVAVNGRSIAGKPSRETTAMIRGRPGTFVTLTVVSNNRRRDARLRRAEVHVPPVEARLRTAGGRRIGVVRLSEFTNGAHGNLRGTIDRQLGRGAKGIVLDLRGNGGGLLSEAVLVTSIFIPEGEIVSTKGRSRPRRVYNATGSSIPRKVPVVVLVDRGSASASEIVAAALQDRGRARVVGTHTFGKGVFQQVSQLPNGGAVEITVGEYFTPKGRVLGGGGIRRGAGVKPDVRAADNPRTPPDEALNVALRTLATQIG
jgi:carboxyl-terminal processing protease